MQKKTSPSNVVYLGLGANIGNKEFQIKSALRLISSRLQITHESPWYQSAPVGPIADQPDFYNLVIRAKTELAPQELIDFCLDCEKKMGRNRLQPKGPRTIDIDILLYEQVECNSSGLQIPHPEMAERLFVLKPLLDIYQDDTQLTRQQLEKWSANLVDQPIHLYKPTTTKTYENLAVPKIMAILNLTADSFSGDGLGELSVNELHRLIEKKQADGASIIDLGAQSTRPGAVKLAASKESARLFPRCSSLKKSFPDLLFSVDTFYAETARQALDHGFDIINDVSFGSELESMAATLRSFPSAQYILCHNAPRGTVQQDPKLGSRWEVGEQDQTIVDTVLTELNQKITELRGLGVKDQQIILDPGLGFGKSTAENLELLAHIDRLVALGYPCLLGASRKSFLGYTLNLPVEERDPVTLSASLYALQKGVLWHRVHNVAMHAQAFQFQQTLAASSA